MAASKQERRNGLSGRRGPSVNVHVHVTRRRGVMQPGWGGVAELAAIGTRMAASTEIEYRVRRPTLRLLHHCRRRTG
jgi:hypothetical protein